jgi:hypothetical protein
LALGRSGLRLCKRFGLVAVRALTHDLRRLGWLRNLAIASGVEMKSGAATGFSTTVAVIDVVHS